MSNEKAVQIFLASASSGTDAVQWLFRKTGTMGSLASQVDIGLWVQAWGFGFICGDSGYHPEKNFEIVCAKSCTLKHFNNGNVISMLSPSK